MLAITLLVACTLLASLSHAFVRFAPSVSRVMARRGGVLTMVVSEKPLSQRVKDAAIQKFSGSGDVSRIVTCWDNFVAGKKMDRFVGGNEEIKQTADCFVDGLKAICFHDVKDFSWTAGLEENADVILKELTEYEYRRRHNVNANAKKLGEDYIQTISPTGDGGDGDGEWLGPRDTTGNHYGPEWKTLGLQDRSVWSNELRGEFPETIRVLESNKVPSCEVFFAKQGPNSGLLPHSDKNNFIITCHLGLDVPEGDCFIQVGNEKFYWKNGKTCIFDTSIFHSTRNDSPRVRYVLLIRFWHPDLTDLEIEMFKFIFEYLDYAAMGDEALEMFEMKQILLGKDQHKGLQTTATAVDAATSKKKSRAMAADDEAEFMPRGKKSKKKKASGGGGFGSK